VSDLGQSGSGGAGVERASVRAAWREQRELVEEIAGLVAERVVVELGGRRGHAELIDAREVARILGCRRSWVYEHKAELPLVRLGIGSRPRLRFDRAKVEAMALAPAGAQPKARARPPRSRRRHSPAVPLLEIKRPAP
jgi:predicted DNA-binding transcriptional regulator AlpA